MNKSRICVSVVTFSAVFFLIGLLTYSTCFSVDADTVALWHFNEGSGQQIHDDTGNGHDSVLGSGDQADNNDPDWTNEGYAGSALEFNGDQYVNIPNDGSFDLEQGTIELWFKLKNPIQGNQATWIMMISKAESDDFNSYLGFGDSPAGKLRYKMEKGGDEGSIASNSNQWDANQWYFVAATFGPNGRKLYVDGVLQQESTNTTNSWADINVSIISIGCYMLPDIQGIDKPYTFEGVIDEVRISDIERSPDELGDYLTAPVEPVGKIATTWAGTKARY